MTRRAGRLARDEVAALPVGPIRDADEERRYWHAVGITGRIRVHRELAADHDACPLCGEQLREPGPEASL